MSQVWMGSHRVSADAFAVELWGHAPELLADAETAQARVEAALDLGADATLSAHALESGLAVRAEGPGGHVLLRSFAAEPARALLTAHTFADLAGVVNTVEGILLRLQPQQARLIGIHEARASPAGDYPPDGAFFVEMTHRRQSAFQTIEVGEHPTYGRLLFLNGETQIASSDEALYSASLVGPALAGREVRRALILGGGDCGVLRELLARGVGEVTMIEIDQAVIETASEHFPAVVGGSRQDPRANIIIGDAFAHVADHPHSGERPGYDLVVYDLSDTPLGLETYDAVCGSIARALAPGGGVAVQCGSGVPMFAADLRQMLDGLERHFADVRTERVVIPSFLNQPWVFAFARKRG